jgi:hypothetical protein
MGYDCSGFQVVMMPFFISITIMLYRHELHSQQFHILMLSLAFTACQSLSPSLFRPRRTMPGDG